MMHAELVEKKRWVDNSRFLHALNFCMLLPGPEAQQLAIYIGWLWHRNLGRHRRRRAFVIPSIFILWALELHLCRLWSRSLDCRGFLWIETGRPRHCGRGCHSHR